MIIKGFVASANGDNAGPLKNFRKGLARQCLAVAAQEHHALEADLPRLERDLQDLGYHGIYAPACPTGQGGSSGGVAVLAPMDVMASAPLEPAQGWAPQRPGVLAQGPLVAGHVRAVPLEGSF